MEGTIKVMQKWSFLNIEMVLEDSSKDLLVVHFAQLHNRGLMGQN